MAPRQGGGRKLRPSSRDMDDLFALPDQISDWLTGGDIVAGVDEAGRGPWAGPVVTAAVVLDPDATPDGLNDSKKLSEIQRAALFDAILATSHVAIASASAPTIDAINIRAATLAAMTRAVKALPISPSHALIDGRDVPPGLPCPGAALIKGDGRIAAISAASIVAKVMRDRMMIRMDKLYPGYGFAKHKGYGTAVHQEALQTLGPCPLHRLSFKPIAALIPLTESESG